MSFTRDLYEIRGALGALLLAGALAAGGCRRGGPPEDAGPTVTTLGPENIAVAVNGTVQSGPVISGSLTAEREADLRAQVSGSVLATYVDAGERVGAGQLLVRIDDAALRDAELSARSGVTSARNALAVAERELQRSRVLLDAGAIAQRDYETAERTAVAARAQLADAEARLAAARQQLQNTRVTAPFDGAVSARPVSAGDVVQPGALLVSVVDPTSLKLEGSVPAGALAALHVGSPVQFTVSGLEGRVFDGRITRVNPIVDPATRQVQVQASIPNTGGRIAAGLFASGRVATETATGTVVPYDAIDRRSTRPAAMLVKSGKVQHVEVALGLYDPQSERVIVTSGVAPGDTLLRGAAQAVTPGTPVRVTAVSEVAAGGVVQGGAPPDVGGGAGAATGGGNAAGSTAGGNTGTLGASPTVGSFPVGHPTGPGGTAAGNGGAGAPSAGAAGGTGNGRP